MGRRPMWMYTQVQMKDSNRLPSNVHVHANTDEDSNTYMIVNVKIILIKCDSLIYANSSVSAEAGSHS